jgi:RNA polymerase sigma-70 factor (ECF subfamily)
MNPGQVHKEVDFLYKQSFGSLLNTLLHQFPDLDFEEAEDILQDSFSAALTHWQPGTVPENPAGWLYQVSRNKAINHLKEKGRFSKQTSPPDLISVVPGYVDGPDTVIRDHSLAMLFACAHPGLAPKTQVILTLKYVANLKVEAIAKVFAMTIDGVDKTLVRGRTAIRENNICLTVPDAARERLPVINRIIYLIFNEGYKASYGPDLIREELCEEALILCKELLDARISDADSKALYALMLFNSARLRSRFDAAGDLVDLENQDRSTWNRELINLGSYFLEESRSDQLSTFHLEASIAWLHCLAPSFENTDWRLIAQLYAQLLRISPNPFAELNYAVALFYSGDREKAFELVHGLLRHPFFNQYYLLNATLGKFHLLNCEMVLAREYFRKAIDQTHFEVERKFIRELLNKAT